MRTPEFWYGDGVLARLLAPFGWLYALAGALRWRLARRAHAPVPVIVVGNAVAGGAGKTPVAIAVARNLAARGVAVHLLARGYGGRLHGPARVDPGLGVRDVGDEALLLARVAPTWIARDRRAGVAAAVASGAAAVVLDDGLQDPSLAWDLALLVVDGAQGFGNGRVIPAGPLREPAARALARADASVLVGPDDAGLGRSLASSGKPVLLGALEPTIELFDLADRPVLAFAGIGRPAKFFAMLRRLGLQVAATESFADHHVYDEDEVMRLVERAARLGARPVTTEKDAVRLPADAHLMVRTVPVAFVWDDTAALDRLLAPIVAAVPARAPGAR